MTALPGAITSAQWRALSSLSLRRERVKDWDAAARWAMGPIARLRARPGVFLRRASAIDALRAEIESLSDARLRERLCEVRAVFRAGRDADADLDAAFAMVREAAFRTLGQRPYVEQLAGALALARGCVAEMATGEGKTLTATLPAIVNAWRGRGCHVVTANDYLARRDARWMAPLYEFCGVRAAWVEQGTPHGERRAAWHAGVTYCTSKEAAADFLRDRLHLAGIGTSAAAQLRSRDGAADLSRLVMRGLECAIVDEADAVLIDDAVTPLIISQGDPSRGNAPALARAARSAAARLRAGAHYSLDRARRDVSLTHSGRDVVRASEREFPGPMRATPRRWEEAVVQAIAAGELFERERDYIVRDGRVVIVDESTGRLTPDRSWREGLHQAIEAKESLDIRPVAETLARISFQRFFRLYRRLSGMSGTAWEERSELWQVYALPVVRLPTNRPCRRVIQPRRFFTDAPARRREVVEEVRRVLAVGRPVLIGVRSIGESMALSEELTRAGVAHSVLNAVRDAEEAAIIAGAGEAGRVTVATNMAGRGTDIRLSADAAARGGLHVIAAELNDSPRLERQLFGRAARQGDPGSAVSFASFDDPPLRASPARGLVRAGQSSPMRRAMAPLVLQWMWMKLRLNAAANRRAIIDSDDWLDDTLGLSISDV